MTIRRSSAIVATVAIVVLGGVRVAHADTKHVPTSPPVTPSTVQVASSTDSSAKCVPVKKTHPGLVWQVEFYHGKYVHWRHAMHKGVRYQYGHVAETSCNVAYVKWAEHLWHYRSHRAHLHYIKWHKEHTALVGSPVHIGQILAAQRGWTGAQFEDLYLLWNRESGWNPNAYNTSSGACGIPQALPCSKISDHSTAGQIRWGLDYIQGRYGTPAGAWSHSEAYGWY